MAGCMVRFWDGVLRSPQPDTPASLQPQELAALGAVAPTPQALSDLCIAASQAGGSSPADS